MQYFRKLSTAVLDPYKDLDYLSRAKAKYLFYIQVIILFFLFLGNFLLLFFVPEVVLKTLRNTSPATFGTLLTIYFLKRGKYKIASSIFILCLSSGILAGMITRVFETPFQAMSTYYMFTFGILAICTLFAGVRMLTIVGSMFAGALIFVYIYGTPNIPPELQQGWKLNFFDGLIGLIIAYSIGVLTTQIFRKNYKIVRHQVDRSNKQNYFIKNVLKENSLQVLNVSKDLTQTIVSVSEQAEHQASSIEEIVASVEELEAGMHSISLRALEQEEQMAESKDKTKGLSSTMKTVSEETGTILGEIDSMIQRYQEAERNVLAMKERMRSIQSSSNEMSKILKIITDVSGKVNMLALNAAIEAARAGEAGRGFSVVADEISNLADRTSNSVKGIDQLIQKNNEEISSGSNQVDTAIKEYAKVADGIHSIRRLLSFLKAQTEKQSSGNLELEQDSKLVLHLSKEIVESTAESKIQTKLISEYMGKISEFTNNFVISVEDVNRSAQNLSHLVAELNRKIDDKEHEEHGDLQD